MNSSNSYTRWTNLNKAKQHVLQQVPEDSPFFMYPAEWAPTIHSYSFQKKKLPEIIELDILVFEWLPVNAPCINESVAIEVF